MWAMLFLAVSVSVFGLTKLTRDADQPHPPELQSDAIAVNMLMFDREAAKYALARAPFTGTLNRDNLPMPGWYQPLGSWRTEVSGGVYMVTYPAGLTRPAPDLVAALIKHSDAQMMVGINGGTYVAAGTTPGNRQCSGVATATRGCEYSLVLGQVLQSVPTRAPVIVRKLTP